MCFPTVDLIIPTYKPDMTFCLLLQKLQKQTFLIQKLIIVNTEEALWNKFIQENENINDLLENAPFSVELIQIEKEDFDHGGTRRFAVEHSESDIFLCMTQDAMPVNTYLIEEMVKPFQKKSNIAAVYARQMPNKDCSEVEKYTRAFNYPEKSLIKRKEDIEKLGIKTFFCSNVCAAYKRSVYDEMGGFERSAIFNEDMIYAGHAVKRGFYICYSAKAQVIHSHNYTGKQQFHRNFDLAVSQKMHPEVFEGIRSESEGMKMVKMSMKHLISIKKPWLIANLVWQSGCKLLGYKMGQNYQRLSKKRIMKFTMNGGFWVNLWKNNDEAS